MTSKNYFGPPLNLGRDLFGNDSDDEDQKNNETNEANPEPNPEDVLTESEEKLYEFPDNHMIKIREFSFHVTNANFVWKGNVKFAEWILRNRENLFANKRILEIASGTGILAIFMKMIGLNVISSDYDDNGIIQKNIAHNATLNGVEFPHVPHTWGTDFPSDGGIYDVVVGNDFLIYVTNFGALCHTLKQILSKTNNGHFYMCSTRHVETEPFFTILRQNGFNIEQPEPKIWDIYLNPPIDDVENNNNNN